MHFSVVPFCFFHATKEIILTQQIQKSLTRVSGLTFYITDIFSQV